MVQAAERLAAALDAAVRMALLEALSDAAAEITSSLDGAVVEVRLKGRDPQFVVTVTDDAPAFPPPAPPPPRRRRRRRPDGADHAAAPRTPSRPAPRRPPAASRQSLNTWLVDAIRAATTRPDGVPRAARRRPAPLRLGSLARPTRPPSRQPTGGPHAPLRHPDPAAPDDRVPGRHRSPSPPTTSPRRPSTCSPATTPRRTRDVVAATTIEQRGNEIVVLVPARLGGLLGRSSDLALTVTAPHGTALAISAGSADIVATGRYATTTVIDRQRRRRARTRSTDSARLRSGSGRLRVESVAKDAHVVTGSGDIEVGVLSGSGHGAVRLGRRPGQDAAARRWRSRPAAVTCRSARRLPTCACAPGPATSPSTR